MLINCFKGVRKQFSKDFTGITTDIFCHYTALYGNGFKTLRENQEINVELVDGPKGMQVSKCED